VRARSEIAPGFLVPSFVTLSVLPAFPALPALPPVSGSSSPRIVCDQGKRVLEFFTEMTSTLGLRALELSIRQVPVWDGQFSNF
jgi:hypothetical protein